MKTKLLLSVFVVNALLSAGDMPPPPPPYTTKLSLDSDLMIDTTANETINISVRAANQCQYTFSVSTENDRILFKWQTKVCFSPTWESKFRPSGDILGEDGQKGLLAKKVSNNSLFVKAGREISVTEVYEK